ncbi:hypothetical protein Hanom_Chr17g01570751 [Helianthus anomalus]
MEFVHRGGAHSRGCGVCARRWSMSDKRVCPRDGRMCPASGEGSRCRSGIGRRSARIGGETGGVNQLRSSGVGGAKQDARRQEKP